MLRMRLLGGVSLGWGNSIDIELSSDLFGGIGESNQQRRTLLGATDDNQPPQKDTQPPSDEYENTDLELTKEIFLSWDQIIETMLIEDWMFEVLFPAIFDQNYILKNQNYVFGNPVIYLGVRKIKEHTNDNQNTLKIFPQYM